MAKIFIDKNEALDSVVDKITSAPDAEVTIVIPKKSALKESAGSFKVLLAESRAAGKTLQVESVDDEVLGVAHAVGIEAIHPLIFPDESKRFFSDIVPKALGRESKRIVVEEEPDVPVKKNKKSAVSEKSTPVRTPEYSPAPEKPTPPPPGIRGVSVRLPEENQGRWWRRKWMYVVAASLFGVIAIAFLVGAFFGKVTVVLTAATTPWRYETAMVADKAVNKADSEAGILPAELFMQDKNWTQLFPASGKDTVSEKATGNIRIYNAYSSKPQTLVVTTRFVSPDGKVFRLDKTTAVPGAKLQDGKIVPMSIEAAVTADKAGPEYNIESKEQFTIPGFKGLPQYKGFYGILSGPTAGGFIGTRAVPQEKDVAAAKQKASEVLVSALKNSILSKLPPDFRILDGATSITVKKLTVNTKADDQGNFSVFGEAELKAIGFKENDLTSFLSDRSAKDAGGRVLRDLKLSYGTTTPNFAKGQLTFSVVGEGVLAAPLDADALKNEFLGKKISQARLSLASLDGASRAKISFWPFWLRRVPRDPGRVIILVE